MAAAPASSQRQLLQRSAKNRETRDRVARKGKGKSKTGESRLIGNKLGKIRNDAVKIEEESLRLRDVSKTRQ